MAKTPSDPKHSRLPPSSASRWTVCTASVGFIEANDAVLPKDSSVFADEGTDAHALAELILRTGRADVSADKAEMLAHVTNYVEFVKDKVQKGARVDYESRVPLFYLPSQKGTIDVTILNFLVKLSIYIIDLKYGAGVSVYAKDNKQLAIYAESKIQQIEMIQDVPDDTLVTLAIYQPRDRNDSEPVRLWVISRGQLREFCFAIEEKARLITERPTETEFIASEDGCRFCRARGICKTYAARGLEVLDDAGLDIEVDQQLEVVTSKVVTPPTVQTLTREQRVKILAHKKTLNKWLEDLEDMEVHDLLGGAKLMGFKMVAGKSNRQWASEADADKLLSNHLAAAERRPPGDLVSPAQAEKLLKGKKLSSKFENKLATLIVKPAGKPTLVTEDDPRSALQLDPGEHLEVLPSIEDLV